MNPHLDFNAAIGFCEKHATGDVCVCFYSGRGFQYVVYQFANEVEGQEFVSLGTWNRINEVPAC